MKYIIKRKNELLVSKWSGGSTTELFVFPAGASYKERDFEVRISSATVESSPSTFTELPDYHRVLMPLSAPLRLVFEERGEAVLSPFEAAEFEGGWKTVSYGICTDIGVMLSAGWKGRLFAAGSGVVECAAGFTCVYALGDNVGAFCGDGLDYIPNNDDVEVAGGCKHLLNKGDFLVLEAERKEKIILSLPAPAAAIIISISKA